MRGTDRSLKILANPSSNAFTTKLFLQVDTILFYLVLLAEAGSTVFVKVALLNSR